ncbi:MAG: ATP-binding protein, partial [Rhabdochlamydiaceae bacterium]
LGTHMTGRHTDVELYPFSFFEFLIAKSPNAVKQGLYSTSQVALLTGLFKEYLLKGGMPEAVVLSNERMLTEVVDDIIRKDILARYSIRKPLELKSVLRFLISNSSNMITYRSVAGNFGIKSSVTIEKYISYAAEAYLLFEVRKFERKLKMIDKNPRKVYCVDSGILTKNAPAILEHKGAILENVIAVHLKRLGKEFYYYKNEKGHEADFVIPLDKTVIQVCYELNAGNKEREAEGLLEAAAETNAKEAFIVTLEQEEELRYKNKKINVRPAWRWLLENEQACQEANTL